ncbi:MAG: MFS transporter, partial [Candidatus Heimdallarchaeota archaeon]
SAITIFGWIIATDFWSFLLYQITVSLSYAMFYTATQIYVNKHTTPKNKGKYIGYLQMSSQMGSFTGGLTFSLLLVIYSGDYYAAMWFMIAFPIVSTLIILFKFESNME